VEANGGQGRYDINPVVGIFQDTFVTARLLDGMLTVFASDPSGDDDGDGTVPRWSATQLELADKPVGTFVTDKHGSLQNVDAVLNQVSGILSWKKTGHKKASPFDGFKLKLDDLLLSGQPVPVRLETQGPSDKVVLTVQNADTGRGVGKRTLKRRPDGSFQDNLRPLPPGVYRITAEDASGAGLSPVHDVFAVIGDETA